MTNRKKRKLELVDTKKSYNNRNIKYSDDVFNFKKNIFICTIIFPQ